MFWLVSVPVLSLPCRFPTLLVSRVVVILTYWFQNSTAGLLTWMRYAALNQGDDLATFGSFRPIELLGQFPSPTDESQSRYSDEQLMLALYL